MKIIHLSDLHIGKRVNEFSMLEDQEYILLEILRIVDEERPNAVIIAGDVYDKSVPSAEAVRLLDDFLTFLAGRKLPVFMISGNHDSPERIAFGSRLMDRSGIYLSPVYDGQVTPRILRDDEGEVAFYMLPFIKPAHVRAVWPEEEISSYTDAVRRAIDHMEIDPARRNVLIAHQYVTGAERSESEDAAVGGLDNVDAAVFEPFDYTALGHIHGPQQFCGGRIRYCGTPLKYSFSERNHTKSVTVVELNRKGTPEIRTVPLQPRRDMREIRGTYQELTLKANWQHTETEDYLHIILTDEEDVPDAMARLRTIYPNVMKLDYDNTRTRAEGKIAGAEAAERKSGMELFAEFYEKQNGQPMSQEQYRFSEHLFEALAAAEEA